MRNKLIITAIAASLISGPALASEGQSSKEELIGITSGATIGAIAGGPIGLIVGAAIGAKAAEKYEHKNDKIDSLNASLDSSQQTIAGLEQNIDALEGDIDEMGGELQRLQSIAQPELLALMQAGIEMDLLFRTDEHTLADTTGSRLQTLATTLAGMPDVYVQLDGETFVRREVGILLRWGERVLVDGLTEGERLVTLGGAAIRRATLMTGAEDHGHVH